MADRIRVKTPVAILSYPDLYQPKEDDNGKKKFGAAFVFPPGTDLSVLQQAIVDRAKEEFGDKAVEMLRKGHLKQPIRKDDKGKYEQFGEGVTYINAKSDRQPGVVSRVPDPNNGGRPMRITEEQAENGAVYPGVKVIALVSPFFYNHPTGGKGISFGLDGLQVVGDGDRLDSRVDVSDQFDADESAAADLADLEEAGDANEDETPEPAPEPAKRGRGRPPKAAAAASAAPKANELDALFNN